MSLADYQFQFGTFQYGAGTPFVVISVDGLEGVPELRIQDDNRGFNDGALTGRDFYQGRQLSFIINTFAGNGLSAQENYELLKDYLVPQQTGTQTLTFKLSGSTTEKIISSRVRARATAVDPDYTYGMIRSQVTMFCPDPRYYDNVVQVLSLTQPPAAGGRTYNRVYNVTYGSTGPSTNIGLAVNSGNVYTEPFIAITGPVTNPSIGYVEANLYVTVNVTLASTDRLTIDLANRLVSLNNSAARNLVNNSSDWWSIPANTTATISFTGSSTNSSTSAVVNWQNAYI